MRTELTRREFLRSGAVGGAGLVIAFYLPAKAEPKSRGTKPSFQPNAWLQIDPEDNVTIWVGKSEMGQGVRTSLPMIVAEELDADWTRVRIEPALADTQKYGNQLTGGSTSVRTSWERLRKAGAQARAMLIAAAAQNWGVAPDSCRTENGSVIHELSGRRARYGSLAEAAAKLPVPEKPPLKNPRDFRIIGQSLPRLDIPEKVDGSAGFGIDVRVPGMLFGVVARCPVFGGKVARFDATRAKAVKGVRAVAPISSGVAVIADSTWAAMEGRKALDVTWNEGPHAALTSAEISRRFARLAAGPAAVAREEGDAEAALKRAARKLEAVYEVPYLAHATMEPMNATAYVRPGSCEVWAPTQFPSMAQQVAGKIAGLPPEKVTVHITLLGGGFGRRAEADYVADAVETSKAVGAPVQVLWTREDDMQHDVYRPASYHVLRAGLDADGRLIAWTHRVVAPSIGGQRGEKLEGGLDTSAVDGAADLPYAIPNLRVDYVMANTAVPTGYWRSVYASQTAFANECFLDEIAAAAGKDPVELRRALLNKAPHHKAVLELVAEKSGWGQALPAGRFRGLAVHGSFHSCVAEVAEVSLAKDGTPQVHRVVCAIDCGLPVNPAGVASQMQSGIVYGLSAALRGKITIDKGRVQQSNFDDYQVLRFNEMPQVEVHIVPSSEAPTGTGEPGLPPIAPAVANAVSAARGQRVRKLPILA
ncbi:MAG TPA: xanthine dehydrogenase family protein molybdopterin-binding subunit [Terriglobales bacterium]|nr:xanthine dehydrogenase family protein molybdopterin-binding subunit [Terriglobales bacterium]